TLAERSSNKACSAAKFAPPQSQRRIPREDSKGVGLKRPVIKLQSGNRNDGHRLIFTCYFVFACLVAVSSRANRPPHDQNPGPGFSAELSGSSTEVIQALNEVLEDQMIHGTHVFDKEPTLDRKSTRLNSCHLGISYAVFCLKKKRNKHRHYHTFNNADGSRAAPRTVQIAGQHPVQ